MFQCPWSLVLPLHVEQTPALGHHSVGGWSQSHHREIPVKALGPPSL